MSTIHPNGISIISLSAKVKEHLKSQLTSLLGPEVPIRTYSINEGINEKIYDKIVLISNKHDKKKPLNTLTQGLKCLLPGGLNHFMLEDIRSSPMAKMYCLSMNKDWQTRNLITKGAGINHINLYPYYPTEIH